MELLNEDRAQVWDMLVVGAGVAGLTAAITARKQGLQVLVLEREDAKVLSHDQWDNVHGWIFEVESLIPPTPDMLEPIQPQVFLPPDLETKLQTSFVPNRPRYAIDRRIYAQRLLNLAQASGVTMIDQVKVEGPIIEDNQVVGVTVDTNSTGKITIRGRVVLDASGLTGVIRRKLPPGFGIPPEIPSGGIIWGYRAYFNKTCEDHSWTNIMAFRGHRGLAWVNTSGKYADVLLATFLPEEAPHLPERLADLREVFPVIGTTLQRGGHVRPIVTHRMLDQVVGNGVILVGDAGCMAHAMTGSGIIGAMIAGKLAANVTAEAIRNGDVGKAALWPYAHQFVQRLGAYFASVHYTALLLFSMEIKTINFAFRRGIIQAKDLQAGQYWEPAARSGRDILGKFKRAFPRWGTILKIGLVLAKAPKIEAHWKTYPATWNPEVMRAWSRKNEKFFQKLETNFRHLLKLA